MLTPTYRRKDSIVILTILCQLEGTCAIIAICIPSARQAAMTFWKGPRVQSLKQKMVDSLKTSSTVTATNQAQSFNMSSDMKSSNARSSYPTQDVNRSQRDSRHLSHTHNSSRDHHHIDHRNSIVNIKTSFHRHSRPGNIYIAPVEDEESRVLTTMSPPRSTETSQCQTSQPEIEPVSNREDLDNHVPDPKASFVTDRNSSVNSLELSYTSSNESVQPEPLTPRPIGPRSGHSSQNNSIDWRTRF
jgi:hypothetical protein